MNVTIMQHVTTQTGLTCVHVTRDMLATLDVTVQVSSYICIGSNLHVMLYGVLMLVSIGVSNVCE